ncbi:MAG: ribosome biogenesis GTP-binding protein YihA/YsxC [Betaproteobacteria bacterium]
MFDTSVAELHQLPPDHGAEIAFAGRSNAGKSSALNAICGRRKLAFVSKTPGRTQLLNFFTLDPNTRLVDLPGYGYAKVPAAIRGSWERLIGGYLETRQCLRALVIIMDIRHPMTVLDGQMLQWFSVTEKPVLVLLTKADKLTRHLAHQQLAQTRGALASAYPSAQVQLLSSVTKDGVPEARHTLEELLHRATE